MSKLIIKENPVMILPSLAVKIGVNEAVLLQQIHYWVHSSSHIIEGKKWIYNTYKDWQKQLPFWSESTIKRSIKSLEDKGFLITANWNKCKMDKTKWYTINYKLVKEFECLELFQVESSTGQIEPSKDSELVKEEANVTKAIPEITSKITTEIKKEVEEAPARAMNPFQFFEQNGFGTIGAYISQKITNWCDDLSDELVILAMEIATERGAKNWGYVEKILINWAEKAIQTVEQAQSEMRAYSEQKDKRNHSKSTKKPFRSEHLPNWFYEDQGESKTSPTDIPSADFDARKRVIEERLKKFASLKAF